jgi:D-xylonolactonase
MTSLLPVARDGPRCLWNVSAELGEGPVWVAHERALYFVDIMGCAIHRWREDGFRQSWIAPAEPGFIVPCEDGGFICGLRGGLYNFDPATARFTLEVPVERNQPRHRINDGFVDATGRLWFGTMHDDACTVGGALYSLQSNRRLRVHDAGYIVTNGPAVSPNGRRLYHTDSAARAVYVFDLSEDGLLTKKRLFVRVPPDVYPDGMAVDAVGNLWIALFNGWRIETYSPQGEKLAELRFPCAQITKLAFGGADLKTVFVTTGRYGLTPQELVAQPLGGSLFSFGADIPGLPPRSMRKI